jgi:hypothetical protein
MAMFFKGQLGTQHKFDHAPLFRLCSQFDQIMTELGIDGCVCFDHEAVRPDLLDHITNTKHDVYVVLQTETNLITEFASTGLMDPFYARLKQKLDDLAKDRCVILTTAQNNDFLDGPTLCNLHHLWIPGATMIIDGDQWAGISPVREKNFQSSKHWISLNYGQHHHRNMMAMILLGHDLGLNLDPALDTGNLYISPDRVQSFESWQQYWGHSLPRLSPKQCDILESGFQRLVARDNGGQPDRDFLLKHERTISPSDNFDRCLRHHYSDSVIEIINDTTFYNPAGTTHNEKYRNAVMGMNMPLIVSNLYAVREFKELGFDVFDDVLDHSYDSISDPMARMFALVDDNLEMLRNRNLARLCWMKNIERLVENIRHLQRIEETVQTRAIENFRQKLFDIGLVSQ